MTANNRPASTELYISEASFAAAKEASLCRTERPAPASPRPMGTGEEITGERRRCAGEEITGDAHGASHRHGPPCLDRRGEIGYDNKREFRADSGKKCFLEEIR